MASKVVGEHGAKSRSSWRVDGRWALGFSFLSSVADCCFCFTVSACKGLQSTSNIPALPETPTGGLGNDAKGIYERAYFWNMGLRFPAFIFLFSFVSALVRPGGKFIQGGRL